MIIKVTNPYWDKEYKVIEDAKYFESCCKNISVGNEEFIIFHNQNKEIITINPRNFASIQIIQEEAK